MMINEGEDFFSTINHDNVYRLAMGRHSDFWLGKEGELKAFIQSAIDEIASFEKISQEDAFPGDEDEARKIKAIWVLSGAGTYDKPLTDTVGDLMYKDKPWAQNTDHNRIDYGVRLFHHINKLSGEEPYVVYNGIEMQDDDLVFAINEGRVNIPINRLFVPKGEIIKTLDQVKLLKFPPINYTQDDKIAIISHAPHLARVLRMANVFKPFPLEAKVKLFPMVFPDPSNEVEFTSAEIMGIIGYVSRGDAAIEPYPYEI